MGRMRSAAVAATVSALIVAGASPAVAAETDPLVVTSTGLTEGQDFSSQLAIRPVWTEGAVIAKVEIYVNGNLRTTALNGNWSKGLHAQLRLAEDNTDISVTVKVYDTAGNTAEATTLVHADQVPPTATLTPAPGTKLGGTITWTATDLPADVAEVALRSGRTTLAATTAAPWTITWNSVGGAEWAQIVVTDRAGNARPYPSWHFDNTAPSISAELRDFDRPIQRVRGRTELRVSFSDRSGVNRSQWWIDGKLVQSTDRPSGTYGSELVVHDFGTTARTATVEVRAWDRAGNLATRTYSLIVDVTGPTITSVTPANGTLVRGSRITSTVRATDPAGISYADLNNFLSVAGPGSLTGTIGAGADGRKTLTWQVHDELYNATTVTRTVIVDNTRPVLKVTKAPKSGAKVPGRVKVTASATDRNGVNRVELLINGKVVARGLKAGYTFTINTKKYGKKIRFQLRAYDRAGNVTTTATRTWRR